MNLFHQNSPASNPLQKFKDFESPAELIESFTLVLNQVCEDVGIKGGADSSKVARVINFMMKYYKDFTIRDIADAFDLLLAGELDEWLPKNSKGQPEKAHYQEFSIEYITRVLNAYRKMNIARAPKAKALLPEKLWSPQDIKKVHDEYLNELIKWADGDKMETGFVALGSEHNYNLFLKWNLVPEDGNMVLKFKEPYKAKPAINLLEKALTKPDSFFFQRAKYIRDAITKLHKKGKTLKQIIEKYE